MLRRPRSTAYHRQAVPAGLRSRHDLLPCPAALMIDLKTAGTVAGALGLFLLGMSMLTDGLKLAAGPALQRILRGATRTRLHALGSGVLVTAMVQSSSAVTVATIGFVNAGLLSLGPALWLLFGANVGTTMTSWIVALVGLKFDVGAIALPLVGVGALLRLTGSAQRRGAIGTALAGFGLLFFGISLLQEAFTGLAEDIELPQGEGIGVMLAQLGIGVLLTVMMQSSSAAMAITLTAAQGGLVDLQGGAAVVIGANIGTTVTALIAVIDATSNARRAAAAHVVFNVTAAIVALLMLPWLVDALAWLRELLGRDRDPASGLALFHTSFNLIGVLVMWPIASALARRLEGLFGDHDGDEARPRFLDDNVLAVPTLAIDALARELERAEGLALRIVRGVLDGDDKEQVEHRSGVIERIDAAVARFVERLRGAPMPSSASGRLAELLRVQRYQESAVEAATTAAELEAAADDAVVESAHHAFRHAAGAVLAQCDPASPGDPQALRERLDDMEECYEQLKAGLLQAGAEGRLLLDPMEQALRRASALRRAVQQLIKARERLIGGAAAGRTATPAPERA